MNEIIFKHALCSPQSVEKGRSREVDRSAQTIHTSNAKCVGVFSTYTNHFSNSLDITGALQFNSDSVTEVGTDPTDEGFSPARVSPLQTSARVQGLLGLLTNQL